MKRPMFIPAVIFLLSATACTRLGPARTYEVVGSTPSVVRAAFNADAGKVRVLMLVSPTCGACLNGASEVSGQIAEINNGKDVPLYVLWVPRSGGQEKDVPSATRVVTDSFARQYWDGDDLLGIEYRQVLGWRDNAWDVYLLYSPRARWEGNLPPAPDFFMHQTWEQGPRLDPSVFGARVKQLLKQ